MLLGFAGLLVVACAGQPKVLVDAAGTGNASETVDSASSQGWDIHWSYDCSTTGGHGIFVIDVFDADRTPDFKFPGVSEEGDRDTGVYHVPRSGRFYLEITTTCKWTVKVLDKT